MKPAMFWSFERVESFAQRFPFRHHKKETDFFFHSQHRDLHLNKMVAIETVNYIFSRARVPLRPDYVTANIIHIVDIVCQVLPVHTFFLIQVIILIYNVPDSYLRRNIYIEIGSTQDREIR